MLPDAHPGRHHSRFLARQVQVRLFSLSPLSSAEKYSLVVKSGHVDDISPRILPPRTIVYLSIVYTVGQVVLAVSAIHDITDNNRDGIPDNMTFHM